MSKLTSQNARKKTLTYTSQLVNYHHQTIRQISARTIRSIIGEKTFYMHRTILYITFYNIPNKINISSVLYIYVMRLQPIFKTNCPQAIYMWKRVFPITTWHVFGLHVVVVAAILLVFGGKGIKKKISWRREAIDRLMDKKLYANKKIAMLLVDLVSRCSHTWNETQWADLRISLKTTNSFRWGGAHRVEVNPVCRC